MQSNQPKEAPGETDGLTAIKDILAGLVRCVVTSPDQSAVAFSDHGALVAYVIQTKQEDVRRVIGSKGKHFKALSVIATRLGAFIGTEVHLAVDEKSPPPVPTSHKAYSLGKYNPENFNVVKGLIKSVIEPLVEHPDVFSVNGTQLAKTFIIDIRVHPEDHDRIYGDEAQFDYGKDGAFIGSVKNIFDGIGKNHGMIIKIVLNKV